MLGVRPGAYSLQRTCRCCLRDLARLAPLDSTDEMIDALTIGEALMELANVQFNLNDGLPQKVCRKCIAALRPAFAFRKMCRENDAKLRDYFEQKTTNSVLAYEVHFLDVDDSEGELRMESQIKTELTPRHEQAVPQPKDSVSNENIRKRPDEISVDACAMNTPVPTDGERCAATSYAESEVRPVSESNGQTSTEPTGKLKLYNCKLCPNLRNYTNSVSYEKHMATHRRVKSFSCDICKRQFTMKRNLLSHMESHQPDAYRKLCSLCGKDFSNSYKFNAHMMSVHTGERPFKCDVCNSAFHLKHGLIVHKKRHLAVKPHGCSYCDKTFITIEKLTRHIRIHTGERPFVCAHCGKSFYSDTNYKAHLRIHTGERPYRCNICGETFSQSQPLLKHRRKFDHFEPTAARSQT